MTSDNGRAGGGSERRDEVWPGFVHWELGLGGHGGEMVWRCDALRAGRLYNRSLRGRCERWNRTRCLMWRR